MTKVVWVPLYHDPVDGYPIAHGRNDLPTIDRYPGGQILSMAKAIDFKPATMLGSVSGELGPLKSSESERSPGCHTWAIPTHLRYSFGAWPAWREASG